MTETISRPPQQEQGANADILFRKEEALRYFGINGDLKNCFEIGDQRFGVFQVADDDKGHVGGVFEDEPATVINNSSHLIVQLDESYRGDSHHVKGLRLYHPIILGRQHLTDRFNYDESVSRRHAMVDLQADGQVEVTDMGSMNGTYQLSREDILAGLESRTERELITEVPKFIGASAIRSAGTKPELAYEHLALDKNAGYAKTIEPREVVRYETNGGKVIDVEYLDNQSRVRNFLVDSIRTGTLYGNNDQFKQQLVKAHTLASAGDYYGRVGEGSLGAEAGVIRDKDVENSRLKEAYQVVEIARQYGDPYANRFITEGKHAVPIVIQDIAPEDAPMEELDIQGGLIESYTYVYPPHKSLDTYVDKINQTGKLIQQELEKAQPDKTRAIELIAQQYQYGAVARPFNQINNSLFMNLANTQLKLLGLQGVTHGNIDHVAQRLGTDAFVDYFLNYVWAQQ